MFWKKKKPAWKLQMGLDLKRCAECGKHERPCLADGKPATFHRWVDEEKALLHLNLFMNPREQELHVRRFREEGVLEGPNSIEKLCVVCALVEYPDGSVGKVKPELVQFLDRRED